MALTPQQQALIAQGVGGVLGGVVNAAGYTGYTAQAQAVGTGLSQIILAASVPAPKQPAGTTPAQTTSGEIPGAGLVKGGGGVVVLVVGGLLAGATVLYLVFRKK